MEYRIVLTGLGLIFGGAVMVALADLWFSRLLLVYLDAVEANVEKLAEAVRTGSMVITVTGIDLKRDKRENSARLLKTLGWLVLILGLGIQIGAALLAKPTT
jgi:hypothetical protein